MLFYLLSKPDDWEVQPKDLESKKCKRTRVYSILEELRDAGYIVYQRIRGAKGRIVEHRYDVYERPYVEFPDMAEPDMVSPDVDFADAYIIENKESQNTDSTTKESPPTPTATDHETPEPVESKATLERGGEDAGDIQVKPVKARKPKERKLSPDKYAIRQKLFELVCLGSFGKSYQHINGSKGFAVKVAQQIHTKKPDITPEQLEAGYRYFAKKFPDVLKDNDKRLKDADKILHYTELAVEDAIAHPTYGPPDPNCPDCNGRGWWIEQVSEYVQERVICGCRRVEGVNNG